MTQPGLPTNYEVWKYALLRVSDCPSISPSVRSSTMQDRATDAGCRQLKPGAANNVLPERNVAVLYRIWTFCDPAFFSYVDEKPDGQSCSAVRNVVRLLLMRGPHIRLFICTCGQQQVRVTSQHIAAVWLNVISRRDAIHTTTHRKIKLNIPARSLPVGMQRWAATDASL